MATANPYAPPRRPLQIPRRVDGRVVAQNAWRSGRLLVVSSGSVLPDRCVKCNAPTAGYRRPLRLAWHSRVFYLGLFFGLLPFVVLSICLTKRMSLQPGICQRHLQKRRTTIVLAWLGFLASLVILLAGAFLDAGGGIFLIGFLVMVGAIFYGIIASPFVKPKKIDDRFAWVKGVCPQYLAALPEFHA